MGVVRRDEVKLFMQGLSLPSRKVCSVSPLPEAQLQPTSPQPPPEQPHVFEETVDTVGQARVRGMPPLTLMVSPAVLSNTSNDTTTSPVTITATMPTELVVPTISASTPRTTQWRQWKKAATSRLSATPTASTAATATAATTSARTPGRKEYYCRIYGKPMSFPDHSQYRGQRYCPSLYPDVTKEEWLTQRRTEAKPPKAKAAANKPPNPD